MSDVLNVLSYNFSETIVQVLKQAGDNLTRENIMKQALNLDFQPSMMLPGIRVKTSPTQYAPVTSMQLQRFDGKTLGTLWRHHHRIDRRARRPSKKRLTATPQARLKGDMDGHSLDWQSRRSTRAEINRRISQAAAGFRSLGVVPGDCVALCLRNDIPFFEAGMGAGQIGAFPRRRQLALYAGRIPLPDDRFRREGPCHPCGPAGSRCERRCRMA